MLEVFEEDELKEQKISFLTDEYLFMKYICDCSFGWCSEQYLFIVFFNGTLSFVVFPTLCGSRLFNCISISVYSVCIISIFLGPMTQCIYSMISFVYFVTPITVCQTFKLFYNIYLVCILYLSVFLVELVMSISVYSVCICSVYFVTFILH